MTSSIRSFRHALGMAGIATLALGASLAAAPAANQTGNSIMTMKQDLADREKDILQHAALGQPDKQIALALDCAHDTVRAHWRSIRRKLVANDRAHAVAVAIWSGQIAP